MSDLAFVDTETTGVDPDYHEIWEVALIVDGEEHVWQLPVDLKRADPKALEIGRFYERYDAANLTPVWRFTDEFLSYFAPVQEWFSGGLVRETKRHMVGAVPSFDDERLRRVLDWTRRSAFGKGWHYHLIDVEALAVGYLHGQALGPTFTAEALTLPWESDDLSRACGVEPPGEEERHTALGDARWAKRLYEAICGP